MHCESQRIMANDASLGEAEAKEVLRQVEFYFSDSNLPRDKFLSKTVKESEDGLVGLGLICSFKRMKKHLGFDDVKADEVPEETVWAVAETLRKSSFLKVSEDGKRVGRTTELLKPEEVIQLVDSRTVAVSPLPYDVRLEDLESFFCQYGKVNSVRLPRHISDKKHFCGTALVEFSDEEVASKILKGSLVYAGAELEIKPKKDFDSERANMRAAVESYCSNKNESNESGSHPKGLILSFKLNSHSNGERVKAVETVNEKNEQNAGENGSKIDEIDPSEVQKENAKNASQNLTQGKPEETVVTREVLKVAFQRFGTVKYVDYNMGDQSGYIRFEDPDAAVKARASAALAAVGGLIVKNYIATLEAVTGEAEKEYWNLLRGNRDRYRDTKSNRGRGKNNKGGKHFDGKQSREAESGGDGRQHKVQKVVV